MSGTFTTTVHSLKTPELPPELPLEVVLLPRWSLESSAGVVAAPAMDQLVADGPGASLQTSNTISPLLLLLMLPLSPCLFSHDLSIRVLHLPLVVRTSAPPMNAMAGA